MADKHHDDEKTGAPSGPAPSNAEVVESVPDQGFVKMKHSSQDGPADIPADAVAHYEEKGWKKVSK
jgi:hypothetical protein